MIYEFIVEELIAEMKETMISGENIYIRRSGSFVTKKHASKIARNIKANCGFVMSSHNVAVQALQGICREVRELN